MITAAVGFQCPECVAEGRRRTRQWSTASPIRVTQALVVINAVIWLAVAVYAGDLSIWGGRITEIHRDFALLGRDVDNGEYWRLFTSAFLHYGLFHLAMNMIVLVWLGRLLEPAIGGPRLLLLYAVALCGGALGALLVEPNGLTAGASGAVFGLAGATVVAERASGRRWQDSGILIFLVLNIVISLFVPRISLGGHMGGLIMGAIAALILWGLPNWKAWVVTAARVRPLRALPEISIAALGALAIYLAIAVVAPRWFNPIL